MQVMLEMRWLGLIFKFGFIFYEQITPQLELMLIYFFV